MQLCEHRPNSSSLSSQQWHDVCRQGEPHCLVPSGRWLWSGQWTGYCSVDYLRRCRTSCEALVIFWGTGQRIKQDERQQYDHRVTDQFQKNAWCDEQVYLFWSRHMWRHDVNTRKLLIIDSHHAQLADRVLDVLLNSCNTTMVPIPGCLTSVLQSLDKFLSIL